MPARIVASIAGALAVLATWLWLGKPGTPPLSLASESARFVPGAYYAVDCSGPTITIDLPTHTGATCDLLMSSLGPSEETYTIRLDSGPITSRHPVRPVEVDSLLRKRSRHPGDQLKSRPLSPGESGVTFTAGPGSPISDGSHRHFYLHVTDSELENPQAYTRVSARCLREGKAVRVYGDDQVADAEWNSGLVDEVVRLLDEQIIPRSRELLGIHCDVDGDGKLAILITPWLSRLQGGRTSVNGFVRSADFRKGGKPPFSNRADLIYLNAGLRAEDGLSALLAHEYTHAACFSARLESSERSGPRPDEEDWLSEAIAHVAERRHGAGWSNLDGRVAAFLAAPERSPLVVHDYYRAGLWRDQGCRGATFLFLNWLVEEEYEGLLRDLVSDPRTGEQKLTGLTGHSLAELMRHWAIALHRGELAGLDLYGRLDRQELNGLRRRGWTDLQQPHLVELRGTAIACVRIQPNAAHRIVITPGSGARLQVTLNFPQAGQNGSAVTAGQIAEQGPTTMAKRF